MDFHWKSGDLLTPIQKFRQKFFNFSGQTPTKTKIRRNSSIEFTSLSSSDKLTVYDSLKSFFVKAPNRIETNQSVKKHEIPKVLDQISNDSTKSLENPLKKQDVVKLKNILTDQSDVDSLHQTAIQKNQCNSYKCMGSIMTSVDRNFKTKGEVLLEAKDFINQFYASTKRLDTKPHKDRLIEVQEAIKMKGTYELTETELSFGARTAWRNASRCIGRIQWSKLQVFDARCVTTARGMYEAICDHLKFAMNKGNIRSAITVFRARHERFKDFRVWNSQLIVYACYKLEDNTLVGDPANLEFTQICAELGWRGKGGEFDVLPIVVQANGQNPEWFELPAELINEVNITHPHYEWFNELNLKWYCLPAVACIMLDIGGIQFTACPFNGWYMVTEIGRDLADVNRYNKLPLIASRMSLDTSTNTSLWKDKALIELTYAILTSFQKAKVTIVDHHSASESFMKHYENEKKLRGGCPADWVWVVPPVSSHLTGVFHQEMLNYNLKPSYEYQDVPWRIHIWNQDRDSQLVTQVRKKKVTFKEIARAVKFSTQLMVKALAKRIKCTVLYATETGKSEDYAKILCELFKRAFDSKVLCMSEYDIANLEHETLLLIVTSTFGNGDAPEQAEEMKKYLCESLKCLKRNEHESFGPLMNVKFSVFALGNSSYPKFCAFGHLIDSLLHELGAERLFEEGVGDELHEQEESFQHWASGVFKAATSHFCITADMKSTLEKSSRVIYSSQQINFDLQDSLAKWHKKNVFKFDIIHRENLQSQSSGRKTLLVKLRNNECLKYEAGDHIGIYAANRPELVDYILNRVIRSTVDEQFIRIETMQEVTSAFGGTIKTWIKDDKYPEFTLRQALTYFYDITTPLTQNNLINIAKFACDNEEKEALETLVKNTNEYEKWKSEYYANLAEILEQFSSIKLTASFLIFNLPKLQPRFYSISSSPKRYPHEIHLTLLVVEYKPLKNTRQHYGVCSKLLDEISIGESIFGFIRNASNFHLPESRETPIVMIAAGTGIAPFRSFWQENEFSRDREMILYFGCRNPKHDELYGHELRENPSISEYYVAYSRYGTSKIYVQHVLDAHSRSIYETIVHRHAHVYICGGVQLAADVTKMLGKILYENGSHETHSKALEFINELKERNIFHEDIFGNH